MMRTNELPPARPWCCSRLLCAEEAIPITRPLLHLSLGGSTSSNTDLHPLGKRGGRAHLGSCAECRRCLIQYRAVRTFAEMPGHWITPGSAPKLSHNGHLFRRRREPSSVALFVMVIFPAR